MKIKGELKIKLDAAMGKALELLQIKRDDGRLSGNSTSSISLATIRANRWIVLHKALTHESCSEQNKISMGKLMDEVYKTCNDDHLNTYVNNYFK